MYPLYENMDQEKKSTKSKSNYNNKIRFQWYKNYKFRHHIFTHYMNSRMKLISSTYNYQIVAKYWSMYKSIKSKDHDVNCDLE